MHIYTKYEVSMPKLVARGGMSTDDDNTDNAGHTTDKV